jgi:hypothetical protein
MNPRCRSSSAPSLLRLMITVTKRGTDAGAEPRYVDAPIGKMIDGNINTVMTNVDKAYIDRLQRARP